MYILYVCVGGWVYVYTRVRARAYVYVCVCVFYVYHSYTNSRPLSVAPLDTSTD